MVNQLLILNPKKPPHFPISKSLSLDAKFTDRKRLKTNFIKQSLLKLVITLVKSGNVQATAKPEKRKKILQDLTSARILGKTRDHHHIYLADYHRGSSLIREIGRLRELTFRKVGEGTGSKRDLDEYDKTYRHLTLWHKEKQEIIGAYRLGEAGKLIEQKGLHSLYTSSLYRFSDEALPYLKQSLELGRSFVQPDYWGKASLDYLWQGIGAFLHHNSNIRYLFGPVSISADYPRALINELVFYFERFYQSKKNLAYAYRPYKLSTELMALFDKKYQHLNKEQGMKLLQDSFKQQNKKIPALFKQYISLYEEGGIELLCFSVDPAFGNCIDGLLMADTHKLKQKKRARYIG